MTNDLAALSEAAQGANPMLLECVENGVWQIRLVFGKGDDACHAMRQWADAYRAGRLVHIPDGREGMQEVICQAAADYLAKMDPATRVDALTVKQGYDFADAAIAAILGDAS